MGLNLETLIGILVILILLIFADGVRRMIRDRHGRLRMRIDRRFRGPDDGDDTDEKDTSELIGHARVRGKAADRQEEGVIGSAEPPEPADEDSTHAEQQPLFDDEMIDQPAAAEPTRAEPAAEPDRRPVEEVIVFHLIARRPERFDGKALLSLMLESGLRFGTMNIFHRHRHSRSGGPEELQFSVANAVEPGTFDIDSMEDQQFAGLTFFLQLPGPGDALGALDQMLGIGRRLAEELDGELRDEQHSVLTRQTGEHLRQSVQEFERRQRVSGGV